MDRQELLREIGQRLLYVDGRRLRGVVLHGSEARGDAASDSDIDVLVLLEGPIDYARDARANINALYDLVLALERPISAKPVGDDWEHVLLSIRGAPIGRAGDDLPALRGWCSTMSAGRLRIR